MRKDKPLIAFVVLAASLILGCSTSTTTGNIPLDRAIAREAGLESPEHLNPQVVDGLRQLKFRSFEEKASLHGISRMKNLEALQLSGTGLESIALKELRSLNHLKFLSIKYTNCVLERIAGLQNLEELLCIDLPSAQITFGDMPRLRSLTYVSDSCQLAAFHNLPALDSLTVSGRKCRELSFHGVPSVSTLCVSGVMDEIELCGFRKLRTLILSSENLTRLELSCLRKLEDLIIRGTGVQSLDLSSNQRLKSLECRSPANGKRLDLTRPNCPELEVLVLANCSFTDYSWLTQCRSLFYVELQGEVPDLDFLVRSPSFSGLCGLRVTLPREGMFTIGTEKQLIELKRRGVFIDAEVPPAVQFMDAMGKLVTDLDLYLKKYENRPDFVDRDILLSFRRSRKSK